MGLAGPGPEPLVFSGSNEAIRNTKKQKMITKGHTSTKTLENISKKIGVKK